MVEHAQSSKDSGLVVIKKSLGPDEEDKGVFRKEAKIYVVFFTKMRYKLKPSVLLH